MALSKKAAKKSAAKKVAKKTVAKTVTKKSAAKPKASSVASSETGASKSKGVEGSVAPSFALKDQAGALVRSDSLKGKPYVLYFYPKDDTTGCTKEACGFRDQRAGFGKKGVRVIGVSPDSEASHQKFVAKYGLNFTLLSDPEKELAHAYGVWVEKQNYGRTYMGIERSTFFVDASGKIKKVWRRVRVDGHVESVLAAAAT